MKYRLIFPAAIAVHTDSAASTSLNFLIQNSTTFRKMTVVSIRFVRIYENEIYFNRQTSNTAVNRQPDGTIGNLSFIPGNLRTSELSTLDELPLFIDVAVNRQIPISTERQIYGPQTTAPSYAPLNFAPPSGTVRIMCTPNLTNLWMLGDTSWKGVVSYDMKLDEFVCSLSVPETSVNITLSMLDHKLRPLYLLPPIEVVVGVTNDY